MTLRRSAGLDCSMRYYNADGSAGEMCGNGARCICRFGHDIGLAGDVMTVETDAGLVPGWRLDENLYRVKLNNPYVLDLHRKGDVAYVELGHPGVPHAVAEYKGDLWADADGLVELAPDELIYSDPATGIEVTNIDPDAFGQFSFAVDALKDTGEIMVEDPQQPGNWRPETVDYTQYNLPSIQELPDGVTAQEVIDSTSSWRMAMESIQTNNHSVPVLAVDSVEGMLEFASGRTQITQGRSFSQSEYDSGAAVCLISETLARESGLDVGDTLPLSLYEKEKNLMPTMVGDSDPTASYYLPQRGFQQETEYTIVGLYRQSNEWSQGVASFTPNTVLVPRKSVTCAVETGETGLGVSSGCLWETMVLQNGTIDQMEARLEENGLDGTVTYYDQGYSDIVESLDGYTRVSRTVLLVGLALWAVVLAAYCVLLPMQEGKTALRMWTLGAKRRDIAGQIWTPSALMALAGTIIALAVSIPGMSWATDKIQALTGSDLTLKVSTGQTMALCAGALAIVLAVIALVGVSTACRGIRRAE